LKNYTAENLLADIVIVRHGETEWNRTERFRGMIDIDLNDTGRAQAALTAKRIASLPVSKIYSSPVGRAMETAGFIAYELGMEVEKLPDIRDICFGKLDGMTFEEAEEKYRDVFYRWLYSPHEVKFPGGESLAKVRERASGAVERIIRGLDTETVVLVSHKVVRIPAP